MSPLKKNAEDSIEQMIARDPGCVWTMKTMNRMEEAAGEFKKALNKGLPRQEAEIARLNQEALTMAVKVIEKVWSQCHAYNNRR